MQTSTIVYLPRLKKRYRLIYLLVLPAIPSLLALLPLITVDVSAKAVGITRPVNERTEIKSVISGIIDTIFYRDGDSIPQNAVILRIRDMVTKTKRTQHQFEISQSELFIHDLRLLGSGADISTITDQLVSPLYQEQASRFLHRKTEQEALLKKANKELEINTTLAREKVISPKEFFDIQLNQEKTASSFHAFVQEQLSAWQQDLIRYKLELSQYKQQLQQINADAVFYEIRSPVSGTILGMNNRYAGGLLAANETFCMVSPEETIIGECYVQTKDIGLLKTGQPVRFQLEAFDYNYFGVLTGRIIRIDNDFTASNSKPVFKVYCSFDQTQLHLKNGFTGCLKKGLSFQANFIVARRTLWQLLFDKLDNWLNPNAPTNMSTNN
jgi:HlyD family secretion protein